MPFMGLRGGMRPLRQDVTMQRSSIKTRRDDDDGDDDFKDDDESDNDGDVDNDDYHSDDYGLMTNKKTEATSVKKMRKRDSESNVRAGETERRLCSIL